MLSKSIEQGLIAKYEFVFMGLMLITLHISLYEFQQNSLLTYALLLSHLGFFLLWQPLLGQEKNLNLFTLITVCIVIAILHTILGWWFIALWIIFLSGLTGGSALIQGFGRTAYALAAVILFIDLSLIISPNLFDLHILDATIIEYIHYGILLACISIIFWPKKHQRIIRIDHLHSLIISFALFAFYVTSILISFTSKQDYIQSLLITTLSLAAFLFLIALLWMPKRGFSTLAHKWEQHILNIGNPFEHWVNETARLGNNKKIKPEMFLQYSIENLLNLAWVSGVRWRSQNDTEFHGTVTQHNIIFQEHDLTLELYSHIPMGSALKIHAQLLLKLMAYFYMSKEREMTLKNQAHLKAVYETGSKLTHDIKNILQSLQTLTSVISFSDNKQESHEHMEKQLPLLTQRLQNTLDKLQVKSDTGQNFKALSEWWIELENRYHGRDIDFSRNINTDIEIDTDVLDTIMENLFENARSKRQHDSSIVISACVKSEKDEFLIEVCDSGDAVLASRANKLFEQILPSKDGYGIGLYQSAKLARQNGYEIDLAHNENGRICFNITCKT
jgi:nitrogen-specific signal transduction histidine kinase